MGKKLNNIFYADVLSLEEKLQSLESELITPKEKNAIEKAVYGEDETVESIKDRIDKLKEKIIELPDEELTIEQKTEIIREIVRINRYFSQNSELIKNKKRKLFLSNLSILEEQVSSEFEKVEEYLTFLSNNWNSIESLYDEAEKGQINRKLLKILFKFHIEKVAKTQELDAKIIDRFAAPEGQFIIREMLIEKSRDLSGMSKVVAENWISLMIDTDTGNADRKIVDQIARKKVFWDIMSGKNDYSLEELNENNLEENSSLEEAQDVPRDREELIKEIAKKYGIKRKYLVPIRNEAIVILEKRLPSGKLKYDTMNVYKQSKLTNGDRDRVVAVIFDDEVDKIEAAQFNGYCKLVDVVLPSKVKTIGQSAFKGTAITNIEFPKYLTYIGEFAFADCVYLEKVIFNEKLTTICDKAFIFTGLESVQMPKSVKNIGSQAFFCCASLKNVQLNEGLDEIGIGAFGSSGLEFIEIPSTVDKLEEETFKSCTCLKKVKLNKGLTSIGKQAFANTAIEKVEIPGTVLEIGEGAFEDSNLLSDIKLNEGLGYVKERAFSKTAIGSLEFPKTLRNLAKTSVLDCPLLRIMIFSWGGKIKEEKCKDFINIKIIDKSEMESTNNSEISRNSGQDR